MGVLGHELRVAGFGCGVVSLWSRFFLGFTTEAQKAQRFFATQACRGHREEKRFVAVICPAVANLFGLLFFNPTLNPSPKLQGGTWPSAASPTFLNPPKALGGSWLASNSSSTDQDG